MSSSTAELLHTVDPAALGARIRNARIACDFTQSQLAGEDMTVSYVSRIESGARRPKLALLRIIAARVGAPVDDLLRGATSTAYDEIRLGLDYAELALKTGEAVDAERQAREHLASAEAAALTELVERGRFVLARALESLGRLDESIALYEAVSASTSGLRLIECGIALTRVYRDSDDLALALEAGERAQAAIAESGLEQTSEALQLRMTIASTYSMRGDLGHATRIATTALEQAEELGSASARAAAYWNASVFSAERGDIAGALPLASRALALLSEGTDARNTARLRLQVGDWQIQQDPPLIEEGLANMVRGRAQMAESHATRTELIDADIQLARGLIVAGQPERALELATDAQAAAPSRGSVIFAEATVARALALAALQRASDAHQACLDAMAALEFVNDDNRSVAQAWLEVADVLESVGDTDTARISLRHAVATTGLRSAHAHHHSARSVTT